jgi:exopolysaccharide production protein ExoQ
MPLLALTACICLVVYLFRVDARSTKDASTALWIPLIWAFFAGSRFLSHWLNLGAFASADSLADGSPVDRLLFGALIGAGLWVLKKRQVDWARVVLKNPLVWLFFVFGLVSVFWSPFPFVSLKRLFKAIGNIVMVLVILTEPNPYRAAGTLLRRLGYLTLPLSIVFIKWFPELGREYHSTGTAMFTGVGMQKNSLGQLCLLVATYCLWSLLYASRSWGVVRTFGVRVELVLLAMIAWLMSMANSATALGCLVAAVSVQLIGRSSFGRTPRRLVATAMVVICLGAASEAAFSVSSAVINALGRRSDLTTRVPMWQDLIATNPGDPVVGVGYEAYYLTPEGRQVTDRWKVSNAHNGYLEVFLNSGFVGLGLVIATLLFSVWRLRLHPPSDMAGATLRLSLLVIVALYNWTESTFRGVSNIWLVFFLASMEIRHARRGSETAAPSRPMTSAISRRHSRGNSSIVTQDAKPETDLPRKHATRRHLMTRRF